MSFPQIAFPQTSIVSFTLDMKYSEESDFLVLLSGVLSLVQAFLSVIRILYAFTFSDIKTTIIPVTLYGLLASQRLPQLSTSFRLLTWIWLFLLQFNTANQMHSVEEDAANKPYRPIPKGLISVQSTRILRRALIPICLYQSYWNGVLVPGVILTLAFIVYNEGGLDARWYSKNLMNGIGIVTWNVGSSMLATSNDGSLTSRELWTIPLLNFFIIVTTIHVQDFRDVVGDAIEGRITLPILWPNGSRWFTMIMMNLWTFGLSWFLGTSGVITKVFMVLGAYTSLRVYFQRTEAEDKVSYRYYVAWQALVQTLPFMKIYESSMIPAC